MTRNTDSTPDLEKSPRKFVITREGQLSRLLQAVGYVETHNIVATRANLASVARRFWVRPKLLETAMGILAEGEL